MKIDFETTPLNDKAMTPQFLLKDALVKAQGGLIKNVIITAELIDGKEAMTVTLWSDMSMGRACFMHRIAGWNLDNFLKKDMKDHHD